MHAQLHLTLCASMDCSLPGSSVHGIFQARILEWVAISSSKGSSWSRDGTHVFCISCTGRPILYHCAPWEAHSLIIMLKLLCIIYKTFFFFLFSFKTHFLCFFLLEKVIQRMWPAGWLLSWAWSIRGSSSPFTILGIYGQSFTMTQYWEINMLLRSYGHYMWLDPGKSSI